MSQSLSSKRLMLTSHPDFPPKAVDGITVEVSRPAPGTLNVRYIVRGQIDQIALPNPGMPNRADELWRKTCFEAFVRPDGSAGYFEFNLSPSRQWAAYQFTGYREGMTNAEVTAPRGTATASGMQYEFNVTYQVPSQTDWRLNIPVVIEEKDGTKSFWAPRHAPGKPDFHHADVFICDLDLPKESA